MRFVSVVALALLATIPAVASATIFSIDFENNWDGGNGDINNYYNGGTAAVGTATGPNLGVSFVNVSGLSNSASDPAFPFYSNAPSPIGTAYAHDTGAFLNVAGGVNNALSFFYSTPSALMGAITAYSGLNGSGTVVGSIDLAQNDFNVGSDGSELYDTWNLAMLHLSGIARSFDFTGSSSVALFDNLATVPEPATVALLFGGAAIALRLRRRR